MFVLSLRSHLGACGLSRGPRSTSSAGPASSLLARGEKQIVVQNELLEPDLGDSLAGSLGDCLSAVRQLREASLGWGQPTGGRPAGS